MANLTELEQWEDLIYQLETTDPVKGGNDGISNRQAKQLANRTAYLKQQVELKAPAESPGFTGEPSAPTAAPGTNSIQIATTEFVKKEIDRLVGYQKFTSSGTFVVPTGVTEIVVSASGGGGGGGGGYTSSYSGEGGGGGDSILKTKYTVMPGESIPITIGAGGTAGNISTAGGAGGNTIVGSLITLNGGGGGNPGTSSAGGASAGAAGGSGSQSGEDAFNGVPGSGGATLLGSGGAKRAASGLSGVNGGGGAGGYTNWIGGAGGAGIVIIEW